MQREGAGEHVQLSEFVGESAKRRAGQAARAFSIVVMLLLLIEFIAIAVAVCCILFDVMLLTALLFNSFVCVIWLLAIAVDIVVTYVFMQLAAVTFVFMCFTIVDALVIVAAVLL